MLPSNLRRGDLLLQLCLVADVMAEGQLQVNKARFVWLGKQSFSCLSSNRCCLRQAPAARRCLVRPFNGIHDSPERLTIV